MKEHNIVLPVKNKDIKKIKMGDKVYISGIVYGARDLTLIQMFDKKNIPDVDFSNSAIFYCGPVVRKIKNKYKVIAAGPTTSIRMEKFTKPLVENLRIKIIIGKGELSDISSKILKDNCACYVTLVGGASALITRQIVKVENVFFEDLMPQCLWVFKVKNLGPGIVAIDSSGNNIFSQRVF